MYANVSVHVCILGIPFGLMTFTLTWTQIPILTHIYICIWYTIYIYMDLTGAQCFTVQNSFSLV